MSESVELAESTRSIISRCVLASFESMYTSIMQILIEQFGFWFGFVIIFTGNSLRRIRTSLSIDQFAKSTNEYCNHINVSLARTKLKLMFDNVRMAFSNELVPNQRDTRRTDFTN